MTGLASGALVAAVWQGILLASLVGLGLRLLPKTPAAVRFAIWFGVFLVVTALPLASLWPHSAGAVPAGGRGAWLTFDGRWSLAIAAVWAAASLVRAIKLVVAAFRVRGLWKRAKAIEAGRNVSPWSTASNMGHPDSLLLRRAKICVSDEVDRPTVIGFFAPKILIPDWLLERLTAAELEQIVLHEVSHLGRRDDWMNLLQKVALVLFPLNPALAWVERRLCFERELAVDEGVLRAFSGKAGAATAYASCLATVAEHRLGRRGLALALGALGRESELGRRVGRILRRGEAMRPAHARLVLGGALLGLVGVAVGLDHCPQLVGFADKTQAVAQADVLNRDGIGMSAKAWKVDTAWRGVSGSQEVRLKAALGGLRPESDGRKSVPQRLKPEAVGTGYGIHSASLRTGSEAVRLTRIAMPFGGTDVASREFSGADRKVARMEPQPTQVVQWLVVAWWQGADGARLVLTTATTENPAARAQRTQSDFAPLPEQDSEQVHPYAAVPVRGGWLVFQL
jgi:Zn-dependent protease with chaperone function